MPAEKVRVAILDDHQSIIDGYTYRLNSTPEIEVVATANFGEELETVLEKHPADVLLLDLSVRTSPENPNPFPILFLVPKLLQKYPDLNVLIISMFAEPGLMKSIIEAGASGYILKDDLSPSMSLGTSCYRLRTGASTSVRKRTAFTCKPMPRMGPVCSLPAKWKLSPCARPTRTPARPTWPR